MVRACKEVWRTALFALVAALLVPAAACTEEGGALDTTPPAGETQPAPQEEIPPDLAALIREVKGRAADLRGLEPLDDVGDRVITREEAAERLEEELDEDPAFGDPAVEDLYQLLDFIGPDDDLKDLLLRQLQSQVAGFYIPDEDTLFVLRMGEEFDFLEEVTLAHEYVHALQDQHFDLDRLDDGVEDDRDAELALRALPEGDASLADLQYTFAYAEAGDLASAQADAREALEQLRQFPQPLVRLLQFPYEAGRSFVGEMYGRGGWPDVDALYERPPETTEQVLHPEKYDAREGAVPVDLPDARDLLGRGWKRTGGSTLGEFDLRNHLQTQLRRSEAYAAAAGWGGGRWAVYRDGHDNRVLVVALAWDTPGEAGEFTTAYRSWLEARSGGDGLQQPAAGVVSWSGGDRSAAAVGAGDRTYLVIADRAEDMARARDALAGG